MYSRPTHAPTPSPSQNRLFDRMRTSAHNDSWSTEMTRSSSTIGPACGISNRMSEMSISLSREDDGSVCPPKGEGIAQDPTQRFPETAPGFNHVQNRQLRIP